jgi:hypothetical protein
MGWNDGNLQHYKCYMVCIDSQYWQATTLRFKQHNVEYMWHYYYQVGNVPLPKRYYDVYNKYINGLRK